MINEINVTSPTCDAFRQKAERKAAEAIDAAARVAETVVAQAHARAAEVVAQALSVSRRRPMSQPVAQAGTDDFRRRVAVRAYLKAASRGFLPGRETDDWLQSERELLLRDEIPDSDRDNGD